MLDTTPNARVDSLSRQARGRAGHGRHRRCGRHVRRGELLARSRRLHLEHQDHGGARSGPRHAGPLPQAREAARLAHRRGRDRDRGGRRARILDLLRDRDRARLRPYPAQGRPDLDAADDDGRAQGPRGEGRLHSPARREARRQSRRQDLEGIARGRGREARLRHAALCADHRRRSGRDRARRAPEATRRADDHRRRRTNARAIPGASATSRSACTIRSGTTICPISTFRRTGRCSRPRTRSATGWKCTPR